MFFYEECLSRILDGDKNSIPYLHYPMSLLLHKDANRIIKTSFLTTEFKMQ